MNIRKNFSKLLALRIAAAVAWMLLLVVAVDAPGWADTTPGYLIHGNDQLNVVVYGEQTLSQTVTVLPDGNIALPLVGAIRVAGLTPDQAANTIAKRLQKYVRHPVVTVGVVTQGQLNVLVLGNVKTPGKYALPPSGRLTDAIAAAGGLGSTSGAYPNARVGGSTGTPTEVSLQKLLHDGDVSANVPMQDGYIVYIPAPLTITVEVMGNVSAPGEVQLNEGDRLSMAIAKAAGNTQASSADLNHIHVTRKMPDGTTTNFEIDLYKELEQGDISKDLVMQPGDVVYVPQARKGLSSTVFSSGFLFNFLFSFRHLLGLP